MATVRVVVCVAVLCAAFGPAAVASDGTAASEQDAAFGGEAATAGAQEEPTPGNNTTTVQHRDPDARNRNGDVEQVQGWLIGQLAGRLAGSSAQISRGQYEQARELLGDDYDARLGQLVEVSGETEATRSLRQTRENQRELADAASEYRETLAAYREARRNGNTERARRLGRELERLSGQVNTSATGTAQGYEGMERSTGRDFSAERVAVEELHENVSSTQAAIRDDIFVETALTVSADREAVSFTDPLAIEGRVAMANGTALADREVTIRVGERRYAVRTDEDGAFSLAYRPTRVPVDTSSVAVAYVPADDSPFLASNATLPVDVAGVTPTVTAGADPDTVGYDETLRVSGRVGADGVGAPRVPVRVLVGGVPVATATTDAAGRFEVTASLPAAVTTGERSVEVVVAQGGRAIERASAATAVTVVETRTGLTVNATATGSGAVRVTGQLRTADGAPLPNRSVAVAVPGADVRTVETGPDGRIATTVRTDRSGTLDVNASFDGQGTNLGPSHDVATVALAGAQEPADGWFGVDPLAFGAVGLLAAVLLAVLAARGGLTGGSSPDTGPEGAVDAPASTGRGGEASAGEAARSLLSTARWQLAAGRTNESVMTAYAAARRALDDRRTDRSLTHWEFYRQQDERLGDDARSSLRDLTTTYERAAFAVARLSDAVAETALGTAERLTDVDDDLDGDRDGNSDARSGGSAESDD